MARSARAEKRRLAAILAADVIGYAGLIANDEAGTLSRLRALFREVVQPQVASHGGRIFRLLGDAVLAEFSSAVGALHCAIAVQAATAERALTEVARPRVALRIGIALGDVVVEGGDLYGDGVNIAARLEALAEAGGILVSSAIAEQAHGRVDCTLEDAGPLVLKNIPNPVQGFRIRTGTLQAALSVSSSPGVPSLAVMPFTNLSGDPQQDYFAQGIAEELTTALSRVRWFSVIARTSMSTEQGRAILARRSGRELEARYLLEGSVRRAGGRVRITCQLIEAETGHHVWAERFDGDLGDIFTLQDSVAEAVAGAVEPSLERAEIERVRAKPTADLGAYDLYLWSLPPFSTMTEDGCKEALALLRQATVLDPGFALAKAHIVACQTRRVTQGWGQPEDREEGVRLANEVLAANSADPLPLVCVVYALGVLARDAARALDVAQRALALNPNSAWVRSAVGSAYAWTCDPAPSAAHFSRAIELDPHSSDVAFYIAGLAFARLMAGQSEEALSLAEQAIRKMPACAFAHKLIVAALSCLGRHSDAVTAAERFRVLLPGAARVSAEAYRRLYRDQNFVETLVQAWRASGLLQ